MTHPLYQSTHLVDQFLWHTYSVSSVPHPFHSLYCISPIFQILLCEFLLHQISEPLDTTHTLHTRGITCVFLSNLCCTPSFANMEYSHWSFPNTHPTMNVPIQPAFFHPFSMWQCCPTHLSSLTWMTEFFSFCSANIWVLLTKPHMWFRQPFWNCLLNEYEARLPHRWCQRPKSLFTRYHPMLSCLLGLLAKSSGFSQLQDRDHFQIPGSPPSDSVQQCKERYTITHLKANLKVQLESRRQL